MVLGHSYGSLVVGEAAARDGVHPGDVIFVGSPGVGVNHASLPHPVPGTAPTPPPAYAGPQGPAPRPSPQPQPPPGGGR